MLTTRILSCDVQICQQGSSDNSREYTQLKCNIIIY